MCAWIGFVVAIVVHELSHAILSRVEGIRVKSMGLLVALVPIGAFTEPDEDQLFGESKSKGSGNGGGNGNKNENEGKKIATARERTRILSAGIMSNYFVALIAFLLFFSLLFSIQPVADTTLFVQNVTTGSPAERAGINPGMFITKVDGTRITSGEDMNEAMEGKERVSLTVLNKSGKEIEIVVEDCYKTEGIMILEVIEGSPAYNAGLKEGMSIIRMDDKEIKGYRDFQNFMNETAAGEVIEVQTKGRTFLVKLEKSPSPHSKNGFLGIYFSPANNVSGMVIGEFSAKEYHEYLCSIPSSLTSINGWLRLTILPIIPIDFGGFSSFNPLLSHFYEPVGIASFLGKNVFSLADVLFWTAWINFLVGLFNALPASPLDGGYIFREVLNPVLGVRIKDEKKKEKFSKAITAAVTIFIFSSIFFTAVGPYIMHV
jgi:RIP metalloprotease RseP